MIYFKVYIWVCSSPAVGGLYHCYKVHHYNSDIYFLSVTKNCCKRFTDPAL